MEFFGEVESIESAVWSYVIRVPNRISEELIKQQSNKRVVCNIKDILEFQCALMPYGDGAYFININKENRVKIEKSGLKKLTVNLNPDTSEFGLPFPEELKELLDLDDEGNKHFSNLTKGKQRNLIHLIGKPKSTDIRIRKAITVVDYLKSTKGELDFKQLNQALKLNK